MDFGVGVIIYFYNFSVYTVTPILFSAEMRAQNAIVQHLYVFIQNVTSKIWIPTLKWHGWDGFFLLNVCICHVKRFLEDYTKQWLEYTRLRNQIFHGSHQLNPSRMIFFVPFIKCRHYLIIRNAEISLIIFTKIIHPPLRNMINLKYNWL